MTLIQIVILAVIQGLTELLPVSSSAHVIAAAKFMRLDPSDPPFTLLLVMLHTGTMFAVIAYFWKSWRRAFFSSRGEFNRFAKQIVIATLLTGAIGFGLKVGVEKFMMHQNPRLEKAEIEDLFRHLDLLAGALAAAGVLILYASFRSPRGPGREEITTGDGVAVGITQGLCIPFRGFSRSGATISVGLLRGMARRRAEEFSFALAVVLTPAVVLWEARRLVIHHGETTGTPITMHAFIPSLLGMVFSFFAGLVALKLLSKLLEKGQWWIFGVYCLLAAGGVYWMYLQGY